MKINIFRRLSQYAQSLARNVNSLQGSQRKNDIDLGRLRSSLGHLHSRLSQANIHKIEWLWDAEYSVYSQWGEDGILDYLCSALEIDRPHYLDFGAGDVCISNGRWLLQSRGGAGVFVDARNDLSQTLAQSELGTFTDSSSIQSFLDYENSPSILKESNERLGGVVDVFSIDLDGQDYWVLNSLLELNSKVIVVEYQAYLGPSLAITVPQSKVFDRTSAHFSWIYYGASLAAFSHLLSERGYALIGSNRQRTNAFFVRKDLVGNSPLSGIKVPSLESLCDSRGGESRNRSGELVGVQGFDRRELIRDTSWTDVKTGVTQSLAQHYG
jgi:hypothetical protein